MINRLSVLHHPFHHTSLANAIVLITLGIGVATPATAQHYDIEISSDQSTTTTLQKPGNSVLIGSGVTLTPLTGHAITAATGDVWDITNLGSIHTVNGYAALLSGNGSRFTNGGSITGSSGVLSSGALMFINEQDAHLAVAGNGVNGTVTEGAFVLNNAGSLVSTNGMAVNASLANTGDLGASITNSGLIQGRQTALNLWTGATASAPVYVLNLAGGQIRSDGGNAVSVTHSTSWVINQTDAVISGSSGGIVGADLYTLLHVDNAGSIASDAGAGIRSYGGGSVVNAVRGSIEGLGGIVYVRPVVNNIMNQVDNAGSIRGTSSVFVTDNLAATTGSGTGVYFGGGAPGSTNQVINRPGAVIEGTLYGVYSGYGPRFSDAVGLMIENSGAISGQVAIDISAGRGTIFNRGVITGSAGIAIQFDQEGDYDNRLTLDTGSQLNGSVLGGSGHDTLVLNGSGIESLDRFIGFETLAVQGDNWQLTGHGGFTTQTDISSGNLQLDGVLITPAMNIHETGMLTGTGRLIGNISNSGRIAPGSSNDFATLTIQGNYVGSGGDLVLKTRLAADDSLSDKLVIAGDASGDTRVQIINKGGGGALTTTNGIQLVQIDGVSDATFALQGRVVAGAYEYRLFKNAANTEDGNWYLRSTKDPDGSDTPSNPSTPDEPSIPLLRPEVGAYLGNQIAAQRLFNHSLHDRLGEPQFVGYEDQAHSFVWARVLGGRMESQAANGEIDERSDSSVVQIGGDLGVWENADSRLLIGVMAGYGSARTRARAQGNTASATGELNGYNLGVYSTWYQDATQKVGPYVDTWLQYARYDNTVKGNQLSSERYKSYILSASLESGWAFVLAERQNNQVLIELQAQAIYSHYAQDGHIEANGTHIHSQSTRQMQTRLGVRLYERNQAANGHLWQPYLGINWWHGSGNDRIAFDDVVVRQNIPKNRYEMKTGIQAELAKNWTIWGAVAVQSGQSHYTDVNGTLGARYLW